MFWRGFSYGVILSATAMGCVAVLFALFPAGWAVAIIVGLLGFSFVRIYLKGDRPRQRREAHLDEQEPEVEVLANAFEFPVRDEFRRAA